MNESQLRNNFQNELSELISDVERVINDPHRDPYTDASDALHEHDTRRLFVDRLLELLGWQLGIRGNVQEEARIKSETTRFMDYVGVNMDTQAPVLIVEAKAWEKPYISARLSNSRLTDEDLLVSAICHFLDGKTKENSPVINVWHDFIEQVSGYVETMYSLYGHKTPCAVLTNGSWLVIFTQPVKTFVDGKVSSGNIKIFSLGNYIQNAQEIFDLLHCSILAQKTPYPLRPTQLRQFVDSRAILAVFHGLHIHFEKTGSAFYSPKPQIIIYPVLIIQRNDGVLIIVSSSTEGQQLSYTKVPAENDMEEDFFSLDYHLATVAAEAKAVLTACEEELGISLTTSPLSDFKGFPSPAKPGVVNPLKLVKALSDHSDEWIIVTGTETHYLTAMPLVDSCKFHSWSACHQQGHGIGSSALSVKSIANPRAIFIDREVHHCAHQIVQDRRATRCQIMAIDERTCCQACVYVDLCWTSDEKAKLPCSG